MAAAKETKLGQVTLVKVRTSFFKAFEKTSSVADGREGYRSNFLMDPSTPEGKAAIKACNAAIAAVKKDKWKEKADKVVFKEGRLCFRDGDTFVSQDTGEIYEGYEGMMALSTNNQNRPTIVDRDRTPLSKDDGRPYSGCYVNAVVRFYAVSGQEKGGNGIFCTLEGVQYHSKGEAFGAAALDAESAFDDLGEEEEGDDGLGEEDEDSMI